MNYWHDIDSGTPENLNVIIEIPKGSSNKYEIDKKTGLIALDRANYSSFPYPFDYGFVPQTLWEDDDPLDVVVLTTFPLHPGILVRTRPITILEMVDAGESDYKLIAVPVDDKRWEAVHDLSDLNEHMLKEIKHFFGTYKTLKGKDAVVEVGDYKSKEDTLAAIEKSFTLYKEEFGD